MQTLDQKEARPDRRREMLLAAELLMESVYLCVYLCVCVCVCVGWGREEDFEASVPQ